MKETDRADARRRIRDAATGLLATDGMSWTMAELAAQAGLSRGVVYRVYADRAALLSDVLDCNVAREDLAVLGSVRWTEWRPASVEDWRAVHALLVRGERP